jgi:hypothetical protein
MESDQTMLCSLREYLINPTDHDKTLALLSTRIHHRLQLATPEK